MTSHRKQAARAVADLEAGTILARVEITAPIERVWRALTTDELTKWWGSDATYQTTKYVVDLRPGGAWRTDGRGADGSDFHVDGEVLEVDPPRKLVHTWKPSWETAAPTRITYLLDAIDGGGTRVTVRHSGFVARADSQLAHAEGWERVLGWLGAFAAAPPAARYFLCRLIGPRPTFAQDMSPAERAVMQAHGAYWRGKLADGGVIAFGPVNDPAGAWGLGLVAAEDDAGVRAFQAADPALTIGMRYETTPMFTLVH